MVVMMMIRVVLESLGMHVCSPCTAVLEVGEDGEEGD